MDIVFFRLTTTIEITLKLITLVGIVNNIDAYGSGAPVSGSERGIQHYVINFVSDLRQVGGFLRVLRFPPPIKLTATI
jgi:hypothetical protein